MAMLGKFKDPCIIFSTYSPTYIARKIIKRLVRATQVVPYYDLVCAKYSSYVL
jgi:hypothetical protein